MPKFKLKEAIVSIRETDVLVRELTQHERNEWVKVTGDDRYRTFAYLMSTCCVNPTWTEEEATQEPTEVVDKIVDKILKLSNIRKEDDKPAPQPKPRGADALPDSSASGDDAKRSH